MIRAVLYLAVAGVIWAAEGYVFSRFLLFGSIQTAIMVAVYGALFMTAVFLLVRFAREAESRPDPLPVWRYLSLAPMLVTVIGSFISLPILLAIDAAGKL